MKTDNIKHITIGDLVEVSEIMKKTMKDAIPEMQTFCDSRGISWKPDGQAVCGLARRLFE